MSVPKEDPVEDESELRKELVSFFNLDSTAVGNIFGVMQTTDLSFSQAALRLGLVTRTDIDEARARISGDEVKPATISNDSGIVESAIRRISSDRRIVLRSAERVTPAANLILAHDADNPRSERLRALRTDLLLLNTGNRGANVVAILSPGAGEGRSQLAAELAIAFAQLGRRTLLVDADMRAPRLHEYFGSTNDHGLSRSIANFEKPLFHPVVGLQQMHLLTAGPVPPNPLELLSDGRFERLMGDWRNSYEFLVLDTPPASKCADGLVIATMAGRALVLSRAQKTSYESMREMMRGLATTQSRILGAVLNHF